MGNSCDSDGPDAWGCSDHAIGVADGSLSPADAAKEIIIDFWRKQVNAWDQPRWAYLFAQGLIDTNTANAWADEVWCEHVEAETDENEDQEDAGHLIEGVRK